MQNQLGLSERTVVKVMQELKDVSRVKETHQGLHMPNKIYFLYILFGCNENPAPYFDADSEDDISEHEISTGSEV